LFTDQGRSDSPDLYLRSAPIPPSATRIIGLDPGLRRMGWGVVTCQGARLSWVAHGVVAPPDDLPFAERLLRLLQGLEAVIAEHRPEEAAVEDVFVNINPASTLKLGHARACALLAPARGGVPVSEYPTRLVKKAVVGTGGADKTQVAFMVRRLLPTAGDVSADAADALAVAIAHAHFRSGRIRGAA
jgi:crossover junction endodeoxyribonuclease RuvC